MNGGEENESLFEGGVVLESQSARMKKKKKREKKKGNFLKTRPII